MLRGDVVAVGAQPPRSVAPARTSSTTSRTGSAGPGSRCRASARASPPAASCPRSSPRMPIRAHLAGGRARLPTASTRGSSHRDLRRLAAVVALVGHEVLEDHLLDVPVLGVHLGERLERRDALLLGLADADEDAARERDLQLAGGPIVSIRRAGCLVGEPACTVSISRSETDSSISPCEAVTSRSRQLLALEHAQVRVGQQAPLERALAGPDDVGGEVLEAVLLETSGAPPG